jgi:hypothetical protein
MGGADDAFDGQTGAGVAAMPRSWDERDRGWDERDARTTSRC